MYWVVYLTMTYPRILNNIFFLSQQEKKDENNHYTYSQTHWLNITEYNGLAFFLSALYRNSRRFMLDGMTACLYKFFKICHNFENM